MKHKQCLLWGEKAKAVCQDCEDSAKKDWRSENEKTGWRLCGGKEGGGVLMIGVSVNSSSCIDC